MSKGKVLIAAPIHAVLAEGLVEKGYELVTRERISQGEACGLIADCRGVVTSTRLQLDKELLDTAPMLEWIGRMGSGMEVVDVAYAETKGIKCFASPEGNSNAVAEHALGMLLSLNKKIVSSNGEVKKGLWLRDENRGTELEGKTIGIIGFGYTGRALARKLEAFDMNILVYDKYNRTAMPAYVTNCGDLQPIFELADIVSFHVPLQKDTIHYLNDSFITNMAKEFVLVNTSRGKVTDTKALLKGLKTGKIKGACLDVWEEEPIDGMSATLKTMLNEIVNLPQVIITPHIAGYSFEALFKMSKCLLDKIVTGE
jgi:D-3-phosphoglycerate dehydrogenase